MASKYISKKEEVTKYLESRIIPYVHLNNDIDYYKLVNGLSMDLKVSQQTIKDVLQIYIDNGSLVEHRILTLPDEKIGDWLNALREREEEKKKSEQFLEDIKKNAIKKDE